MSQQYKDMRKAKRLIERKDMTVLILAAINAVLAIITLIVTLAEWSITANKVMYALTVGSGVMTGARGVVVALQSNKIKQVLKAISPLAFITLYYTKRTQKDLEKNIDKEITTMKKENIMSKFADILKSNPITIGGTVGNLSASSFVGYAFYVFGELNKWNLPAWALGVIASLVAVIVATVIEIGILKQGWETRQKYLERKECEAKFKQEKELEKEALKALKAEQEKNAILEAEAQAAIEAEKQAREKALYEEELARKVAELKAKNGQ